MTTELFAWDARTIAQICGVTDRTVRHWRQRGEPPEPARRLLQTAAGDLSVIGGESWAGWTLQGGRLCGPDGHQWTAGELAQWSIERQYQRALEVKLARFEHGIPYADRDELARLQAAADIIQRLSAELARLYPVGAEALHDAPARSIAVGGSYPGR